ncbi:MAG: NfeD family protein [Clostridia bacterium]|nr:NfeD family protein [Clostridia bacterium]
MEAIFGTLWIPCIICIAFGIALFIAEMFTPGFGISGCLGFACFAATIVMLFAGNSSPTAALWTTVVLLLVMVGLLIWFIHSFQKGKLSRSKIVLAENIDGQSTNLHEQRFVELIGKEGVAITPLRPAGIALIDNERINVQTNGEFIPKDQRITVVAVESLHIIVR